MLTLEGVDILLVGFVVLAGLLACGYGAFFIAEAKGRDSPVWFLLGMTAPPIGILLALVWPARRVGQRERRVSGLVPLAIE